MHIGDEIRHLREEKGLTQAQLAEGFSTASYISQIERGAATPSRKILQAIAAKLGKPKYHFEALTSETGNRELLTKLERLQALAEQGIYYEAELLVKELEQEETHLWDEQFHGKWAFSRAYLAWRKEELDDALYYFRQALDHYETCGHLTEIARSLELLARVHRKRNDLELAAAYAKRAIGVLVEAGQGTVLLYNLRLKLAVVLSEQGKWDEARALYEELSKISSTADYYETHISLLLGLSHTYEKSGQTQLAYEYATKARILAEQHSDLIMVAVSERVMADGLLRTGELEQALIYLDRALAKQQRAGTTFEQARLVLRKAKVIALQKKYDSAEALISEALALQDASIPTGLLILAEANAVRGLLHKEGGDIREAISHYRKAGEMYAQAERHSLACEYLREAAELLFRSGDLAQAFAVQGQALDLAQKTRPSVGP